MREHHAWQGRFEAERRILVAWIGAVYDAAFVTRTFIAISFACTRKLTVATGWAICAFLFLD